MDTRHLLESRKATELSRNSAFFEHPPSVVPALVVKLSKCLDYKYWKINGHDNETLIVELLDAASLCLTQYLVDASGNIDSSNSALLKALPNPLPEIKFTNNAVLDLISRVIDGLIPLDIIFSLLISLGLDLPMINRLLNSMGELYVFRHNHGYQNGTYSTNWNGTEDAIVCVRFCLNNSDSELSFYAFAQSHYSSLNPQKDI